MNVRDIPKAVEQLIRPIVELDQYELVDIEFKVERGRWILRIYVDRNGGITIDECADVSRKIEDVIEIKNIVPHRYMLEVSSPGLDRPLKREQDFQRFSGKRARIRISEAREGRRNFVGRIVGCTAGIVELEDSGGTIQQLPLDAIERARLEIEL